MALYHKLVVKTCFNFALQIFMLISAGLGGVYLDFVIFWFCFFDYTPAIDGIHEIRLALNARSIEFVNLKVDKTVPDSSEY